MESRRWDDYIKDNYPWLAQKDDLMGKVEESILDEAKAGPDYRSLALLAISYGFDDVAKVLGEIAGDEDRHLAELKKIKGILTRG